MRNQPKERLEQIKDQIRLKHYFYRTENTYIQQICRYILFHNRLLYRHTRTGQRTIEKLERIEKALGILPK